MRITVNGEEREIPEHTSAAALLHLLDLAGQRVAVEVNLEIVPRSTYDAHLLQQGDRVEIVRAIGGG